MNEKEIQVKKCFIKQIKEIHYIVEISQLLHCWLLVPLLLYTLHVPVINHRFIVISL